MNPEICRYLIAAERTALLDVGSRSRVRYRPRWVAYLLGSVYSTVTCWLV